MVTAWVMMAGNAVRMLGPVTFVVAEATDISRALRAFPWLRVVRARYEVAWTMASRHGGETRTVRRFARLLLEIPVVWVKTKEVAWECDTATLAAGRSAKGVERLLCMEVRDPRRRTTLPLAGP